MTSTAEAGHVDVILRDGGTLRLRPPTGADLDALTRFFETLSPGSLYLRFHGARHVDPELARPFLDPDWEALGALIGTFAAESAPGPERVVALASYARLRDPSSAEVAFAVADEEQGRGIGTRLLEQLVARASAHGIASFVAEVMSENRTALAVFRDTGFTIHRELEGGIVELRFPIERTEAVLAHVEARDHVAVVASLRPFFEPASVAVIGASSRRGSIGGELFRNILAADFAGAAYPVNRSGEAVAGVRGYPSIDDIPDVVDLAVICLPGERVHEAAAATLARGVRALCVISAGFAETGVEGRRRQEELLALVRAHGARLVGPNCLGIWTNRVRLNATFAPRALPPGRVGFSSQSGALGLALLEKAAESGLGFSSFVSIGNKADVSSNDLLEWWEDDVDTDVVLLYLESFGNPRKFGRIARRLARSKPIVALKSGSTAAGARAASSHTAAMAGSEAAVDALFRQAGVLRAGTLEELVDVTSLLSSQPLPRGRQVAVVTNAGGLGILCADACEAHGLILAELARETAAALAVNVPREASLANPVDVLGSATADTYRAVLPALLADPHVDALIVLFVPPVVAGAAEVADAICETVAASGTDKSVIAVVISAEGTPAALRDPASPVAALPYPESAARALAFLAQRAEWLRRPAGVDPELEGIDAAEGRTLVARLLAEREDGWVEPSDLRTLLRAYGIPVVEERVADDADAALEAAREIGYPVVVKTASAGAHKTETGGVALDLRDADQVSRAVGQIGLPVLVQRYVEGGAELLAGIVQDPVFGPLVAFGPGGVLAELIGGAAFRIAPLSDVDAHELVTSGKAGRLVSGFRGTPPADERALIEVVQRLGRLADDLPEVTELDLNPIVAGPSGCLAVDARARITRMTPASTPKSW